MATLSPRVTLTAEGWRRLHDELSDLRQRRTDAVAVAARDGEHLPYDAAASPSEIQYLDHCIGELEYVLSRAEPVEATEREPGVVGVGSVVDVIWDDGSEETYTIVGPPEIAPRIGRISYVSPVGLALMGRHAGERVTVATDVQINQLQIAAVD
jgi:transcription elongation factor GreA